MTMFFLKNSDGTTTHEESKDITFEEIKCGSVLRKSNRYYMVINEPEDDKTPFECVEIDVEDC